MRLMLRAAAVSRHSVDNLQLMVLVVLTAGTVKKTVGQLRYSASEGMYTLDGDGQQSPD